MEYDVSGYFDEYDGFSFPEQSDFFRSLKGSLDAGYYPDVQGQYEYLRRYAIQLVLQWRGFGFRSLYHRLRELGRAYSSLKKFEEDCLCWSWDCLLGLEEYEEFLVQSKPQHPFDSATHFSNLRLNIQLMLGREAEAVDLFRMHFKSVTSVTRQHPDRFRQLLDSMLIDRTKAKGPWFERIINRISEQQGYPATPRAKAHLFQGVPIHELTLPFPLHFFYATYFEQDGKFVDPIGEEIRQCGREAENLLRAELGLPAIGEGWISETQLLRAIEKAFPETTVIQHGRPQWLGQQHFDVWLPDWNIAVEYHGLQHFEPVEFFGGENAFQENRGRDARKSRLAAQHGVTLIIATEETSHEEIVEAIRLQRKTRLPEES